MARIAKRYRQQEQQKRGKTNYRVGIYARLSVDLDEKKSESIETQIIMIKDFISRYNLEENQDSELFVHAIYSDLGKTGTNFERPGFERLMRDVRSGQINCIIVKDFSRFGRNYIETGEYLERILPFLKVRFISVCDHYDSAVGDAGSKELAMNIKNLVNDMYAKDISKKERVSKRISQKKGDYVGGMAPYGYRCVIENDYRKLVTDPEPAAIVKWIFQSYADGMGIQQIIDALFDRRVHRASDYNKYHHVYQQDGEPLYEWGNSSIRAILKRNNYYGDLVQHKFESGFPKGRKGCDALDEAEWIVTPNAHEAIISREIFDKAQVRLKAAMENRRTIGWNENERAFYNVCYCGDCGRKMTTIRSKGIVEYFCRASRYKDERKCETKYICESRLQRIVRSELVRQLQFVNIDNNDIAAMIHAVYQERITGKEQELRKQEDEVKKLSVKSVEAFQKFKEGGMTKEDYLTVKSERMEWEAYFEKRRIKLEQRIRQLQSREKSETKYLKNLLKVESGSHLNQELVESLIERLFLYGDGRLEINFRWKPEEIENDTYVEISDRNATNMGLCYLEIPDTCCGEVPEGGKE